MGSKRRTRRAGRRSRGNSERSLDSIASGSGEPVLPPSASFDQQHHINNNSGYDSSSQNDTDAYQADLEASAGVLSLGGVDGVDNDHHKDLDHDVIQKENSNQATSASSATRPQRAEPPGTLKKKASKLCLDLLSEEELDDLADEYADSPDEYSTMDDGHNDDADDDADADENEDDENNTDNNKTREQPPGTLENEASKLGLDLLTEAELYELENGYVDSPDEYSTTDGHNDDADDDADENGDDENNTDNNKTREQPPGTLEKEASKLGLDLLTEAELYELENGYRDSPDEFSTTDGHDDEDDENNKDNNITMEQLQREYQDMNQSVVSDDLLYMTSDDERSFCTFDGGISACSLDMDNFLDQLDEDEQDYNKGAAIPTSIATPTTATAPSEQAPVQQKNSDKKTESYRKKKKHGLYKLLGQLVCFTMLVALIVVVVVVVILPKFVGGDDDNCDNSVNCTATADETAETFSRSLPLELWGILDTMVGVTLPVFVRGCSQYWTVALIQDERVAFEADKLQEVDCRVLSQELVVKSLRRRLRERFLLRKTAPFRLETVLQVLVEVTVRVVVPTDEPVDGFEVELLNEIVQESGGDFQRILSTASDFFASLNQISPWSDNEEPDAGENDGLSQQPPSTSTSPPNTAGAGLPEDGTTATGTTTPVTSPYISKTVPPVPVFGGTTQAPTGEFGGAVIALPP